MTKVLTLLCLAAALGACSAQQQATAVTDAAAVCADIPKAEALDPAFATHNPTLVADAAKICADIPAGTSP